jgi:hypothetical protein
MSKREQQQDDDALAVRRAEVARLYFQGELQVNIAQMVGVDKAQITRDLQALRNQWAESAKFDFAEALGRELARLDQIERQAWKAFEKSQQDEERTTQSAGGAGKKVSKTIVASAGEPRFLEVALKCSQERSRLLGLVKLKHEHTGKNGEAIQVTVDTLKDVFMQMGQWEKEQRGYKH